MRRLRTPVLSAEHGLDQDGRECIVVHVTGHGLPACVVTAKTPDQLSILSFAERTDARWSDEVVVSDDADIVVQDDTDDYEAWYEAQSMERPSMHFRVAELEPEPVDPTRL
jgi:hypothetical protein